MKVRAFGTEVYGVRIYHHVICRTHRLYEEALLLIVAVGNRLAHRIAHCNWEQHTRQVSTSAQHKFWIPVGLARECSAAVTHCLSTRPHAQGQPLELPCISEPHWAGHHPARARFLR